MTIGQRLRSRNFDTIRTGEIAYSIVTIVAITAILAFFYFGHLSQKVDDMERLVGDRLKTWNDITNYCEYLNNADFPDAPNPLIASIQELIGVRLAADTEMKQKLARLVADTESGALGFLYAGEITSLDDDGIHPSVRRFVGQLYQTPSALLEARLSELEPSDSILFFSRKALHPLEQHVTTLRNIRSQLTSLRTLVEWTSAVLLPISIWAVWLLVLRPTLRQSLQLQSKIEASERRARITLSSIGEAVLVVGADRTIATTNPAAEEFLGIGREQAPGHDLSELIELTEPNPGRTENPSLTELLASPERISRRVGINRLRVADSGSFRLIDLTAAPIAYPGEIEQGVVLVLRDITSEQKLLEQIHNSDKARAVVQLAAGLAHEFNNAMAIISGARELIALKLSRYEECAALVRHHVKAIEGAVRQSNGLTGQLLAIGSQASLKLATIDILAPLSAAVAMLNQSSPASVKIALRTQLNSSERYVEGDAAALQRAFLNLGLNSLQALAGSGTISISVTTSPADRGDRPAGPPGAAEARSHIVIDWSDSGCGISESNLKRIFEPFFTTRTEAGAAGLGLSVVRGVIVEHQGDIVAASEPGKGTVFTIRLPACEQPAKEPPASVRRSPDEASAAIRALVVEDEPDFSELLRDFLTGQGIRVDIAADGIQASAIFKREHAAFDIVVLDMNLSGKSGADVEAEMRALQPDCRIIASTGYLVPGQGEKGGLHKSTVVMKKPYRLDDLLQTIRRMLAEPRA